MGTNRVRIALWYHCRLFGGEPPIDPDFSIPLMLEQMETIKTCGLLDMADEMHICVNGDSHNTVAAQTIAPPKATLVCHGRESKSMLPTVNTLRDWCKGHPGWLVCFFHIKGVTHPNNALNKVWRKCMERHVLLNWQKCILDLTQGGCDTVGAHWLTKEKYGNIVTYPFWGGMFFWAKAAFLADLPQLPMVPEKRDDWFLSENWIGMGKAPKLVDYAPHWPGINVCAQ